MEILKFVTGPVDTNSYLLVDSINKIGVMIDAAKDSFSASESYINENQIKISYLLLTHSHWDHTADASKFVNSYGAELVVHSQDEHRLRNPNENSFFGLPFIIEPTKADKYAIGGDIFKFGTYELQVIYTPGHTEGGICFAESTNRVIFVGDTLFKGSVGRVDLPGGNREELIYSIKERLFSLDDDYEVYCGHGLETTIGDEKNYNPFVGINSNPALW